MSLEHCMHLLIGESCHSWICGLVYTFMVKLGDCGKYSKKVNCMHCLIALV